MEAQYKTLAGRLIIKVEAQTQKDLFKAVAALQEVFDADQKCGCCGQTDLRFRVRAVDKYDYYEQICLSPGCGARLQFGQHLEGGTLFPKRKSEEGDNKGEFLPNRGWAQYGLPLAAVPMPPRQSNISRQVAGRR